VDPPIPGTTGLPFGPVDGWRTRSTVHRSGGLGVRQIENPSEGIMISPDDKPLALQIGMELEDYPYNREAFFLRRAVVLLCTR
jgi:hypothetical protein